MYKRYFCILVSFFLLASLLLYGGCRKKPVQIGDPELQRPAGVQGDLLRAAYKHYLRDEKKKAISCIQWMVEQPYSYDPLPFPEQLDRDLKRISQIMEMITESAKEYSSNEMHSEARACYLLMMKLGEQMDTWEKKPPLFASTATFLRIQALDGLRGVATELFDDEAAEKYGTEINEIIKSASWSDGVIKAVGVTRKKLQSLNYKLYSHWKLNKTLPSEDEFVNWSKGSLPDHLKASYDDFMEDIFTQNLAVMGSTADDKEKIPIKYIPVSPEKGTYRLYSVGPDGVDDKGLKEFNLYADGRIYENVNMPGDIVFKNPNEMKDYYLNLLRDPNISIYYREELISEYTSLWKTLGDEETDEAKLWFKDLALIRKVKSCYMSAADIQGKLQKYYEVQGKYPDDIWELKNKMGLSIPNDQFSTKVRQIYRYTSLENGQWYRLWSYGPDGDNDLGEKNLSYSPELINDSDVVFEPLKIREGRRK